MVNPSMLAQLVTIVRKVGKVPADRVIEPQTRLVDDLGIDSLDLVAVFLTIQDTYGVVIDDDDITALATVSDLASYVARQSGTVAA